MIVLNFESSHLGLGHDPPITAIRGTETRPHLGLLVVLGAVDGEQQDLDQALPR